MNAASLALRLRKRIATPIQIRALLKHENQDVQLLGRALEAMRSRRFSPEEQARISTIEARRAALCASQEIVQVEDFGAGGAGRRLNPNGAADGPDGGRGRGPSLPEI